MSKVFPRLLVSLICSSEARKYVRWYANTYIHIRSKIESINVNYACSIVSTSFYGDQKNCRYTYIRLSRG